MSMKRTIGLYTLPLWFAAFLLLLLTMLTPSTAGAGGILLVFFAIYLVIASTIFVTLHLGAGLVWQWVSRRKNTMTKRSFSLEVRKAYYIASIVAFGPVLLLALRSVRQLGIVDILLVVLLLMIVIFYIMKREK